MDGIGIVVHIVPVFAPSTQMRVLFDTGKFMKLYISVNGRGTKSRIRMQQTPSHSDLFGRPKEHDLLDDKIIYGRAFRDGYETLFPLSDHITDIGSPIVITFFAAVSFDFARDRGWASPQRSGATSDTVALLQKFL